MRRTIILNGAKYSYKRPDGEYVGLKEKKFYSEIIEFFFIV